MMCYVRKTTLNHPPLLSMILQLILSCWPVSSDVHRDHVYLIDTIYTPEASLQSILLITLCGL
jgi:hypothetical protein